MNHRKRYLNPSKTNKGFRRLIPTKLYPNDVCILTSIKFLRDIHQASILRDNKDDIQQDEEPEFDEEGISEDSEPVEDEEPIDDEFVTEESPKVIVEEDDASSGVKSLLSTVSEFEPSHRRTKFEEFVDERLLVSMDALGNKQMKIKVLDVSDEHPPVQWRFGDRIKITKILVTIKHLSTQEVEEAEFDIEAIERELAEKRHYTSTNRWVPTNDIKNGYVIGSRHTSLISDAVALDYIVF